MSKKSCYFKCKQEGHLFRFPPLTYTSYEKFCKWKSVIRKKDQEKGDQHILYTFKICSRHFEPFYIIPNNRLTRNAVPTLKLGATTQQEESLCAFIEENSNLVTENNFNDELIERLIKITPQLNALGPEKSCNEWAEYLYDVLCSLKTKPVIWSKEGTVDSLIKNSDDFTDLELKILQLWHKETMYKKYNKDDESNDRFEINVKDDNSEEYMIEVGDAEDSKDSNTSNHWTSEDHASGNGIVTFTVNLASGGHKPLLQAADIAPQDVNTKCKCTRDGDIEDEFDAFGKVIAQQLRSMPAETALETQQLLISVIRNKQSQIFNDSFIL